MTGKPASIAATRRGGPPFLIALAVVSIAICRIYKRQMPRSMKSDRALGEPPVKDDGIPAGAMHGPLPRPIRTTITLFKPWQEGLILLAFALLLVCRLSGPWAEGRFQDEEATVFLAYAWHFPWAEALLRPFGGYLNIAANAGGLLVARLVQANFLSLERAPYATMAIGLAVQLLPPLLILRGRADWLPTRTAKLLVVLILAIAPAIEEVFFNIIHIQFHLALAAALILALDVPSNWSARLGYGLLLALGPLCGPGAIVFAPIFLLRAWRDRDSGRLFQFAVILFFSLVQLLVFYVPNPVRGAPLDPASIAAAILIRLVALPTLGDDLAHLLAASITLSQKSGMTITWVFAALAVISLGSLLYFAWRQRSNTVWLLLASYSLAFVTYAAGIASGYRLSAFVVHSGPRYNYIPLTLLAMAVVGLAWSSRGSARIVFMALILVFLFNGATDFRRPLGIYETGPSWSKQVAAWRRDRNHPLAVWPTPWAADLSDRAVRCIPVSIRPRDASAPRYCDNSWIAAMRSPVPEPERR